MKRSDRYALVLDIGTSSIKAFLFDDSYRTLASAERTLPMRIRGVRHEQSPKDYLALSSKVLAEAVRRADVPFSKIVGMGLTNQRETTVIWDPKTGTLVYPAIVWSDSRTASHCKKLASHRDFVRSRTGLEILPYFSASKIQWILDKIGSHRRLLFGTVDTWILWNFLRGNPHVTDMTNASRTLAYNVRSRAWDGDLQSLFSLPPDIFAHVMPSRALFGTLSASILGKGIPVKAVCGDQQSSMVASGLAKGTTKVTYGTGTFLMQVVGSRFALHDDFFTTLVPTQNGKESQYALEAKIDYGGKRIEPVLNNPTRLKSRLTAIAREVDRKMSRLPIVPLSVHIDGGVSRDGLMAQIQERVSGIPIIPQANFHGTAVGVAKLVFGVFLFLCLPGVLFADTGSTVLPNRSGECLAGTEKIECTSWFEQPTACDGWLSNPEYITAEGSIGASVQHYTFCKKDPTRFSQPSAVGWKRVASVGAVAACVVFAAIIGLFAIRKKR